MGNGTAGHVQLKNIRLIRLNISYDVGGCKRIRIERMNAKFKQKEAGIVPRGSQIRDSIHWRQGTPASTNRITKPVKIVNEVALVYNKMF